MTTTLSAINAGSASVVYVIAIEGYPYLLTNGNRSNVAATWDAAGTGWDKALDGAFVDLQNSSSINPWSAFSDGGDCSITIMPDSVLGDVLGEAVGRTTGGTKTTLTVSMDRIYSTVFVKDASQFAATGEVHIGTECIGYTGKTALSFTGLTRGKYAPFAAGALTNKYAHLHSVEGVDYGAVNLPVVSSQPRVWQGRWVGVWLHVIEDGGSINTKGEALCVFGGKIDAVRDDAGTMCTVINVRHVLDDLKDHVFMREPFRGKVADGYFLEAGVRFQAKDAIQGYSQKTASDLVCKVGAAAIPTEIERGYYLLSDLVNRINQWIEAERTAGRLFFYYQFSATVFDQFERGRLGINTGTAASSTSVVLYKITLPAGVATFLGYYNPAWNDRAFTIEGTAFGTDVVNVDSAFTPRRLHLPRGLTDIRFETTVGRFFDQSNFLPPSSEITQAELISLPSGWGIFQIGAVPHLGWTDGISVLRFLRTTAGLSAGLPYQQNDPLRGALVTEDQLEITQLLMLEGGFSSLISAMFYSTANAGYNGSLDTGIDGLGIPAELLLPSSFNGQGLGQLRVAINKPTKFEELINGDLILRRMNVVWKQGLIRIVRWSSPAKYQSIATLDESNKAEPVGGRHQRSSTDTNMQWLYNIFKINFNRVLNTDEYTRSVTIEDRVSIDDHGGGGSPLTIQARNTYATGISGTAEIDAIIASFLAFVPFFSRPIKLITRSIGLTLFESLSAGDICAVSDAFARDPATGKRGVILQPGVVISHKYSPGGFNANGGTDKMVGEVTVAIADTGQVKPYSPSASVLLYTSGTPSITLAPNAFTETPAKDIDSFLVGFSIRIVEVDSELPIFWDRAISAIAGDVITLNSALSAPAYDAAKKYKVISPLYPSASVQLKGNVFFKSEQSYYLINNANTLNAAPLHTDLPQLVAPAIDTAPMDVAVDVALAKTANWIQDHGTAYQSPLLSTSIKPAPGLGVITYYALGFSPIFLGAAQLPQGQKRVLNVGVSFKSNVVGSVTIRVTVSKNKPTGSIADTTRNAPYSEASTSTTSTVFVTGTVAIDITNLVSIDGVCYLLIEGSPNASYQGTTRVSESERQ